MSEMITAPRGAEGIIVRVAAWDRLGRLVLAQSHYGPKRSDGRYDLPGGTMQDGESIEASAVRLAKVKAGLDVLVRDTAGIVYESDDDEGRRHTITIEADIDDGDLGKYDREDYQRVIQAFPGEATRLSDECEYVVEVLADRARSERVLSPAA